MTDFPRGWTLVNSVAGAGTASITVPAIAGVVHVLDSFVAMGFWFGGAPVVTTPIVLLSSSDGTFSSLNLGAFAVDGAAGAQGSDSGDGLDLAAGPGSNLVITLNTAAAAGFFELIRIQGHDI